MPSPTLDARNNFLDGINDINNIIERIALGPQEEVIGLIDNLNSRWNTDFRCTPTFRWQPGFYKKLMNESGKISNISVQKNKVSTYKNQISNGRWMIDSFLTKIEEIDTKLYFLRNSGICFQDNTEDVNRVLRDYRESISSTIDKAMELYPNMNISIYHGLHNDGYSNRSNRTKHAVGFHIYIENTRMNINIGEDSVEVPMGDLDIMISVDLVKNIMNRIRNSRRISSGHNQSGHTNRWNGAIYHPHEENLLYPYISDTRWNSNRLNVTFNEGQNTPSFFDNVCFGNFNDDIVEAAWNGDIIALFTYLNSWTKNFNVGITGPLNGFDKMFHGIWPEMLTDSWAASGRLNHTTRLAECRYAEVLENAQPEQDQSYCERYDCVLKNECPAYRTMYIPPETIEDGGELSDMDGEAAMVSNDATLTEAQILQMYQGVNTIDIRR